MQIFRDFNTEQKHLCWILYCAFGLKYNKHKIFFYNHLKCTIYNQHEKSFFLFVLGTGIGNGLFHFVPTVRIKQ